MRKNLDASVFVIMFFVCLVWGTQQVAIKIAGHYVSPMLQLSIRSGLSALIIFMLFNRRDRIAANLNAPRVAMAGMCVGILFAIEFLLVALGIPKTSTGHITLFLYTAPLFTAVGLHFLLKEERMTGLQWLGIMIAFTGIAVAVQFSFSGDAALVGDFCALAAGLCWGISSIIIRISSLATLPPSCTLFYQLATTSVILALVAYGRGETLFVLNRTSLLSLTFQTIIVAVISYLTWFTLLRYYKVSSLSTLILMTPVMGIAAGAIFLGEKLQSDFTIGSALILAGLLLTRLGQNKTRAPAVAFCKKEKR